MEEQMWKTDVWENDYTSVGHSDGEVLWHLRMDVSIKKFNIHLMHSFSMYFWVLILSDFYFMWCLKKLWWKNPHLLCAVLALLEGRTLNSDPRPWGCGHKRFNENVGLRHILNYKVVVALFFLTSSWSKYLFKYDRIKKKPGMEPTHKCWFLKRNKYYKQKSSRMYTLKRICHYNQIFRINYST